MTHAARPACLCPAPCLPCRMPCRMSIAVPCLPEAPRPHAAAGAPSLVQEGGHVGATDLLSSQAGEVFLCDMEQPVGQVRHVHVRRM